MIFLRALHVDLLLAGGKEGNDRGRVICARAHVRWGQNSPNRNPLREGGAIARRQVGPVVTRGARTARPRGEQQGPGRQAGEPHKQAAPRARRAGAHARRVTARRHRRYRFTRGQDFLARPRARPRDDSTPPRGPLMDLSWTCRRPAVDLTPRRRAGCASQISLSPAHPLCESHSRMEGFQIEGGSTPYPHIALCATAPKLISGRRTSRRPLTCRNAACRPGQLLVRSGPGARTRLDSPRNRLQPP